MGTLRVLEVCCCTLHHDGVWEAENEEATGQYGRVRRGNEVLTVRHHGGVNITMISRRECCSMAK